MAIADDRASTVELRNRTTRLKQFEKQGLDCAPCDALRDALGDDCMPQKSSVALDLRALKMGSKINCSINCSLAGNGDNVMFEALIACTNGKSTLENASHEKSLALCLGDPFSALCERHGHTMQAEKELAGKNKTECA